MPNKHPTLFVLTCDFLHSLLPTHQRESFYVDSCQRMSMGMLRKEIIYGCFWLFKPKRFFKGIIPKWKSMMVGIILRTLPWDTEVHKRFADILDTVQKNFPSDFPSPRKRKYCIFLFAFGQLFVSQSKYLQNIHACSIFKINSREGNNTGSLAEFYLLDMVRTGYSV